MSSWPERWRVEHLADTLVQELQLEIGMARDFFREASVLILVFGLLEPYVNDRLTDKFLATVVAFTVGSYVMALFTEFLARRVFRLYAYVKLATGGY